MFRKITVQVKSQQEADAIERGLKDAPTKAVAAIIGTLDALPTHEQKLRVFNFAAEVATDGSYKPERPRGLFNRSVYAKF